MYLGIDLGTSSAKCVLMDSNQSIVASCSAPVAISRPQDGWSEQNPADWIIAVETALEQLRKDNASEMSAVKGIGLSGHMHGATLLDDNDQIIRPCMLWNDTRSQAQASLLDTDESRTLTGNILFPGFTAPKLAWVAENEPENFKRIAKVLLPKDYLRLWLTGEYVADLSDAAGTGWLDVQKRQWSDALLQATDLDRQQMPTLVEGIEVSGNLRHALAERFGMQQHIVVAGGAGDNAASACGMGTIATGEAFLSLGTSGVLFAATDNYRPNAASAVHTFCHAIPDTWHQMGVILAATDALNWLSQCLQSQPAALTDALDGSTTAATELLFLPYLGGERTPVNDAAARGVFVGLNHSTDQMQMTRAVLQGVAFAFKDSQLALHSAGTHLQRATAIGGGSQSAFWLQIIANTLGIALDVPVHGDFGASLGAARLGMISAESALPESVCTPPKIARTVEPDANSAGFSEQYQRYTATYQALKPIMQASSEG